MKKIIVAIVFAFLGVAANSQIIPNSPPTTFNQRYYKFLDTGVVSMGVLMLKPRTDTAIQPNAPAMAIITLNGERHLWYYDGFWDIMGAKNSVNLVSQLTTYVGRFVTAKGFYTVNDGGGGDFILKDTTGASQVNGMVYPIAGDRAYVRVVKSDFNLKWFGAIGGGLPTFSTDSLAIRNAFAYLNYIKGSKRLYIPNAQDANGNRSFYGFSGTGLMNLNDIEVYGDGKGKSEIRNVSPLDGAGYLGSIFIGSNYETDSSTSPFRSDVKKYHVDTAYKGDTILYFKDAWSGQGHDLYVGEIVAYGCYLFNKNDKASKPLYSFMENNKVKALTDTSITFKYPISFDLKRDTSGEYPQLFNLNDKNGPSRLGATFYTTHNFSLHDMTITQAQVDELADTTISARLAGVWQPGGFFESNFYNLEIDAYSGLGGNLFTYCVWDNIDLRSEKKFMDFGYGSGPGNFIRNCNFNFKESPASDYASAWFISNNGNHGFSLTNITASGNFKGSNFFSITGCRDCNIDGVNINFPTYFYDHTVFTIGNSDTFNTNTNLNINNVNATFGAVGKGVQILGGGDGASISNVNLSNIYLNGSYLYNLGAIQYTFTASGITKAPKKNDTYSTNGSIYKIVNAVSKGGTNYQVKTDKISGGSDPTTSGTLTKVDGRGDATIAFGSWAFTTVSDPNALDVSDIKGNLNIKNFRATSGKFRFSNTQNSTFQDLYTPDSLILYGPSNTGNRFRVYVSAANSIVLTGGEISVIGGLSYMNGNQIGVPPPGARNAGYTGTATWDGTAPTGGTYTYTWSQDVNAKKAELWISLNYSSSGATNTTLTLTWPSDVPLPLEPTSVGSVNNNLYSQAAKILTGAAIRNQTASFAHIVKTGTGTYSIVVSTGSLAAKTVEIYLSFPTQ